MRRRWMVAGLVLAACLAVWANARQTSPDEKAKVEAELLKLERDWLDAEERGDPAVLDRLFAEDFIGTGPGGNILYKDDIVPRDAGGGGRLPKSSLKESVVRVYGTTAVVMGLVAFENPAQPGQLRFTKVYLKRDENWKCVAAHLARVTPPPPQP